MFVDTAYFIFYKTNKNVLKKDDGGVAFLSSEPLTHCCMCACFFFFFWSLSGIIDPL